MSAKIIAVANMKGGVGKTTTVVSLAEALGASGHNVLVVDLDAQANASICLAGDSTLAKLMKQGLTIEGFLDDTLLGRRTMTFANCVRSNVSNVCHLNQQLPISLVPSSPELRHFEYRIIHELTLRKMSWTEIVQGLSAVVSVHLASARRKFDFILIDCAPGISVLTEVSIRLADLVIVPTIADFLSTFGLQAFCTTLSDRGLTNGVRKLPRKPHVLITRRRPVNIHGETAEILRDAAAAEKPPFRVFRTEIPEAVKVGEALGQIDRPGKKEEFPNFSQKWGPIVAPLLADLVQEIGEVFHVHRH